jgi:hypothetical protein
LKRRVVPYALPALRETSPLYEAALLALIRKHVRDFDNEITEQPPSPGPLPQ